MFISSYFQSLNSEPNFDVLRFEVFIKYCRSNESIKTHFISRESNYSNFFTNTIPISGFQASSCFWTFSFSQSAIASSIWVTLAKCAVLGIPRHLDRSINQSINRFIKQSVRKLTNQCSFNQFPRNQSSYQLNNQSINQSICQWISQSDFLILQLLHVWIIPHSMRVSPFCKMSLKGLGTLVGLVTTDLAVVGYIQPV